MHWRIKGAIQKALSYVPMGDALHFRLQQRGGGLHPKRFAREVAVRMNDWALMVGHLRDTGFPIAGQKLVEVGTGWYPTLPFALFLGGAASVISVDLNRHIRPEMVRALAAELRTHVPLVAAACDRAESAVAADQRTLEAALVRGASIEDATNGVVQYRAPGDAAATNLPAGSVDIYFSNSVLEHVPGEIIVGCFREARRILRPAGVMFHSVNCGDHYAYADPKVNQLHYLQYSNRAWRRWDNKFLYQNRLRAKDFTRMARDAGFAIDLDTSTVRPERLAELDALHVSADFAGYTRDELALTTIDFVARNPA